MKLYGDLYPIVKNTFFINPLYFLNGKLIINFFFLLLHIKKIPTAPDWGKSVFKMWFFFYISPAFGSRRSTPL